MAIEFIELTRASDDTKIWVNMSSIETLVRILNTHTHMTFRGRDYLEVNETPNQILAKMKELQEVGK